MDGVEFDNIKCQLRQTDFFAVMIDETPVVSGDGDIRKTGQEMDIIRQRTLAYEYLCRLEEAKVWLEACLKEELPLVTEFEERLRNGVCLAKLGNFIAPEILPKNKIYDIDERRYQLAGLQFRHTDNINKFLHILKTTELPMTFQPETTDIYDKKNMPRVIYCIHALSTHLFKIGKAPLIQDVFGKAVFTDEQIDSVSKDLQKLEQPMPVFQRIGGILSKEQSQDSNALHKAIVHLNELLDTEKSIEPALLNPTLRFKFINSSLFRDYKKSLLEAKHEKVKVAQNHSINDSYVPDEYDELLTQVEVQGHIIFVNYKHSWKILCKAAKENDITVINNVFCSEWINIKQYDNKNIDFYCDVISQLSDANQDIRADSVTNWYKTFQGIVKEGNERAVDNIEHKKAVLAVNQALEAGTPKDLYRALTNPHLEVNVKVDKYAVPLLLEEMKLDRTECGKDLNKSEIAASMTVLCAIASISQAAERAEEASVWKALNLPHAHIQRLRVHCRQRYLAALITALRAKAQDNTLCSLLTYDDIQDCIDTINKQDDNNEELIHVLDNVNKAVINEDIKSLLALLKSPCLNIGIPLYSDESQLYLRLLKKSLKSREGNQLWLEDIESAVTEVAHESDEVHKLTDALVHLNLALSKMDVEDLCLSLTCGEFGLDKIKDSFKGVYVQIFSNTLKKKNRYVCPWVVCHTSCGNTVYVDIESCSHSWITPRDFVPHSRYLSKKDVISIIDKVNKNHINKHRQKHIDKMFSVLQAYSRGYIFRKRLQERFDYLHANLPAIVKIQAWWRRIIVERKYRRIIEMKIIEARLKKQRHENPWPWYKIQEKKIIKIQALWRGRHARKAFTSLFNSENPPFKVVKMFVPMLDFSTEDYEKEIELQTLKSEVVQAIRRNQELSKQLDDMDVKIGLLVQNRITLQDVVAHGLKLNNLIKHNSTPNLIFQKDVDGKGNVVGVSTAVKGLKSLTKECKKLLDGYQHLFYELQTNPAYLSKLLFCIPQNKTNQFLQNVILTLYNFGANTRDEYLLLKLFRYTLEEEISCKVTKPFDVITSSPIVLKMAVNHSRHMSGLVCLRNIIGSLVEKVLNDKDLNIETGPVEIYKAWRNETEMKTGKISSLPYSLSQEEALGYPEVRTRLEKGLIRLQSIVTMFLNKITSSIDQMPFCITYMARVLHRALTTKFPLCPEKDVLKVVGNLVYYQFLNAAIVAPDAFHIINLSHGETLTADQRKNLASVAKILHFAAAKKGFGEESSHLRCLNTFIIECHERMKEFFKRCCQGMTLEEYYSVDEYTEATLLHRPHIYISVQEIVDTHSLLLEYQEIIAPDSNDKLNELLDDLGEVPSAIALASRDIDLSASESIEDHSRTDVCLALVNKFQAPHNDMTNINKLFIKTKELCVSVLPFLNGDHLLEAVCIGTTKQQQEFYAACVKKRLYSGAMRSDEVMTLREHISLLRRYLEDLEEEGYVSREDGYQSIVTSIALDLCNKGKYRQAQRQALATLHRTKKSLLEKTLFYEEQCQYYDQYIKTCLQNLNTGKRSVHMFQQKTGKQSKKVKSKLSVKYSGAKLHERGVLVEIDGLQASQFKNVQFDITPTDHNGVFAVKGKFLGVEMESVDIDIQDLLQRQYEGCTIMDMFGKAKVNVNLLLFLLNSKFYGK